MARTGFNKHDISRDACQLFGPQAHQGYDGWWHYFTGYDAETGEAKPSYLMVKAGAWGVDAAQLHRFWGWEQIKVNWDVPFRVEADDCFLAEDHTRGRVKVGNAARHPECWHGGNGVGTIQLFDRHDKLVDRVHAENIGCEHGEYDKLT